MVEEGNNTEGHWSQTKGAGVTLHADERNSKLGVKMKKRSSIDRTGGRQEEEYRKIR